jgi:hypothetical protein
MSSEDAREIRAALVDALNPLYAGRSGNLAHMVAICTAIRALHDLDEALRRVELREAVTV